MGAGSSAGGGLDGACVNRGAGRGVRTGSLGGRPDWRSGRPDSFAMSRPKGGRLSPLTISFTSEAAKVVESSGQDSSQTKRPARPHRKKGRISPKREPPRFKWKLIWEKSLPTSIGADGSKTSLSELSFNSSMASPWRPMKKTGTFIADDRSSSRASTHVPGTLLWNSCTLPPTSSNRLYGLWKMLRPSATLKTGISSKSPLGSKMNRRDWRSFPTVRCVWGHRTQASSEPPRAVEDCGATAARQAIKASRMKLRRAICVGDVIEQERVPELITNNLTLIAPEGKTA